MQIKTTCKPELLQSSGLQVVLICYFKASELYTNSAFWCGSQCREVQRLEAGKTKGDVARYLAVTRNVVANYETISRRPKRFPEDQLQGAQDSQQDRITATSP